MAVIAPPRQPDSRDAESTVEPDLGGEALIEEAKQHARRRRRRVAVTAIVASVAVAGAVTVAIVAGGAGSSPNKPPSIDAAAEVPPVGATQGERPVQAVASWAGFHRGWVLIFSDGRVLRAGAIGEWIREYQLSPAALDRVLLGRVAAQDVWSDTRITVAPDGYGDDPRATWAVWADPSLPQSYVATEFAACPYEFSINGTFIPASSVLHLLPNAVRDVVLGTERIIPNVRFREREQPADVAAENECFALNSTQVSAIARHDDESDPEPNPADGLFTYTTGGTEPLTVVVAPMMPDGSVVRWGG